MQVTRICIYPIKGTREVSVSEAEVRPRGLSGDRRWMLVDSDGAFLQQRNAPKLSLVEVALDPDGSLKIDAPDMPQLSVHVPDGGKRQSATVWEDTVLAADAGSTVSDWFARYLGQDCRMVFMDSDSHRPVDPEFGKDGDVVSFADAVPLLLASEASLRDLNDRMGKPVPMSRFRPNVTIDGDAAWGEDDWKLIQIGNVRFELTHRCARCVVTTIEQQSGEKDPDGEPLKTLATFRRDPDGVYFGHNMIPRSTGVIQVGDQVSVVS